jgi:hypothetical protein
MPVLASVLVELLESLLPQAETASAAAMIPATAKEVRVVMALIWNLLQRSFIGSQAISDLGSLQSARGGS